MIADRTEAAFARRQPPHFKMDIALDEQLAGHLWEKLRSDRVLMLGLDGAEGGHTRPMTAYAGDVGAPIHFFALQDNHIIEKIPSTPRAVASFASRDYELFASLHGMLRVDNDRFVMERLWDEQAERWFPRGLADPELCLMRLDVDRAQIWSKPLVQLASAVVDFVHPTQRAPVSGFSVHVK